MNIRPASNDDTAFVVSLARRFSEFPLPAWRERDDVDAGVLRDLQRHLRERPAGSHFFVLEEAGAATGFVHLLIAEDFFAGRNCHVSDLAVAQGYEGKGYARALLAFAEEFGRAQGCQRMTLGVFPGNARARQLYEASGYGIDLLRMAKPLQLHKN